MKTLKGKVLKAFWTHSKGNVIEHNAALMRCLAGAGFVDLYDIGESVELAEKQPQAEKAVRRRGRPRKSQ